MINMTAGMGKRKDPSARRETSPRPPGHRRARYTLSYENIWRATLGNKRDKDEMINIIQRDGWCN